MGGDAREWPDIMRPDRDAKGSSLKVIVCRERCGKGSSI